MADNSVRASDMRRPVLEVVAMITLVGWLPGPPLRAAGDEGIDHRLSNLGAVSAPGPEFSPRRVKVPPSLRLPTASDVNTTRAATVRSEPLESKPRTARRPALLIGLYVSYSLLQVLDAQSTIRALHSGQAHEGNPLLSPFAAHPVALVTFKMGLTGVTIYGCDRLYKAHRKLAMISLAAINSGYAYIVQRTYRNSSTR
jgi:hypothetical protein